MEEKDKVCYVVFNNEDEYSFHLTLEAESQLKELIVKLMGQGLAGVER